MAQDLDKAQSRLDNIQAVGPILGALRTISLGNWQMAINKRKSLSTYNDQLLSLLPHIVPYLQKAAHLETRRRKRKQPENQPSALIVALGTERGLCGRYNDTLAQHLIALLSQSKQSNTQVILGVLGSRLLRSVERNEINVDWAEKMPVNNLPEYAFANTLVTDWLQKYEMGQVSSVLIAYNKQERGGSYQPGAVQLIPPVLPENPVSHQWPPYIIETNPATLYARIVFQWTTIQMYNLMLESAVTEHSARFQLMESANQNANRLIEELTIAIQSVRRQQITRELQELAVGAGLIG